MCWVMKQRCVGCQWKASRRPGVAWSVLETDVYWIHSVACLPAYSSSRVADVTTATSDDQLSASVRQR